MHAHSHHSIPSLSAVLLAAAAVGVASGPARAGVIHYTGVLTEASNSLDINFDDSDDYGADYISNARLAVANPDPFVVDFSQLGETTLSITWKAPPGQMIEIMTPNMEYEDDDDRMTQLYPVVTFGFRDTLARGTTARPFYDSNASYAYADLENDSALVDLPSKVTRRSVQFLKPMYASDDDGSRFLSALLEYRFEPSATFRFSSLTLTTTVPAEFDEVFDLASSDLQMGISGSKRYNDESDFAGPDQWIGLVPEPGTLALLGLGGLVLLPRRRRRRRSGGGRVMF